IEEARAAFVQALAVRAGDEEIAAVVEVLEGFVDLALAAGDGADKPYARRAYVDAARARAAAARAPAPAGSEDQRYPLTRWSADVRMAAMLLERTLSMFERGCPTGSESKSGPSPKLQSGGIELEAHGHWLRLPTGTILDLSRHRALRLITL